MAKRDLSSSLPRPEETRCSLCMSPGQVRCSVCLFWYCSPGCQARQWPQHRKECVPPPFLLAPNLSPYLGGKKNRSTGTERTFQLDLLPNEILVDCIIRCLPVSDAINLGKTCRKFQEMINDLFVLEPVVLPLSGEDKRKIGRRYILDLVLTRDRREDAASWDSLQAMNLSKIMKLKFHGPNFRVTYDFKPLLYDSYIFVLEHFFNHGANLTNLDILIDSSPQLLEVAEAADKLTKLEEITFRGSKVCMGSHGYYHSNELNLILATFLSRSQVRKLTLKDLPTYAWEYPRRGRGIKLEIASPSLEVINLAWAGGEEDRICRLECSQLKEITVQEEVFSLCLYHSHASEEWQFPEYTEVRMGGLGPRLHRGCPRLERFNNLDINLMRNLNTDGNWLKELENHMGEGAGDGRKCCQCTLISSMEGHWDD